MAASTVIPEYAGEQTRYKVTEQVDPRTLRYYINLGLVDKPISYEGTSGVYGVRHLLQLVAIKKLQSEYLPLRKIKEIIEGLDNGGLRELIGEEPPEPEGEMLLDMGGPPPMPAQAQEIAFAAEAPQEPPRASKAGGLGGGLLKAIFGRSKKAVRKAMTPKPPPPSPEEQAPSQWIRHELEPGLEVHVRIDFSSDRPKSFFRLLGVRLQRLLQTHKGGK